MCAPRLGATTSGRLAKTAMTKVEMMVMAAVAVIMAVFMSARHLLYPCGVSRRAPLSCEFECQLRRRASCYQVGILEHHEMGAMAQLPPVGCTSHRVGGTAKAHPGLTSVQSLMVHVPPESAMMEALTMRMYCKAHPPKCAQNIRSSTGSRCAAAPQHGGVDHCNNGRALLDASTIGPC